MDKQLERIANALERMLVLLEKKKAPRKEFNKDAADQMMSVWNTFASAPFSKVNGINPSSTRGRNASARWLEKPEREYWAKVIIAMLKSKFLCGENDRKWVADFEFFVRPDTHFRVMEGKFNDKKEEKVGPKVVSYLQDGTPVLSNKPC